ncbi:MAG: hypothetical protein U9R17_12080 [Thermodesulfobacteriota bacterium]|nr:hypothetical protein [Thermodesulfobacteriota bacterium]
MNPEDLERIFAPFEQVEHSASRRLQGTGLGLSLTRGLFENALFPQLFVMLKKLSSEYQLYTCGNFFRIPRFEKKLLFSDSLLEALLSCTAAGYGRRVKEKGKGVRFGL